MRGRRPTQEDKSVQEPREAATPKHRIIGLLAFNCDPVEDALGTAQVYSARLSKQTPWLRFVPRPPEEYVDENGHVDFTGTWKCASAGGDLHGVFSDMGIGQVKCSGS